ncbi:hypothetical protein BDN70DRAFT_197184 [Pholiota conissans]|uniref:Uncharacterized protein n=1 Tax=Pholiota conissans TaxID=109636 RepID=A0A9P5ZAW3_9AGAR|nr:hypothetical protein BDN70DRAFT_197184 [Pholiota conissans]
MLFLLYVDYGFQASSSWCIVDFDLSAAETPELRILNFESDTFAFDLHCSLRYTCTQSDDAKKATLPHGWDQDQFSILRKNRSLFSRVLECVGPWLFRVAHMFPCWIARRLFPRVQETIQRRPSDTAFLFRGRRREDPTWARTFCSRLKTRSCSAMGAPSRIFSPTHLLSSRSIVVGLVPALHRRCHIARSNSR